MYQDKKSKKSQTNVIIQAGKHSMNAALDNMAERMKGDGVVNLTGDATESTTKVWKTFMLP